jgi:hypothetical protein
MWGAWLAGACVLACGGGSHPVEKAKPALFADDGERTDSAPEGIRFDDGTVASGLSFTHHPSRTDERYMYEVFGAGVGLVDVNRDGAPDVICVDSGAPGGDRAPDARNRLFINDGAGHFTDATDAWGLSSAGYGMGVTAADFDGDGWTDLFFTSYGSGERLFRNTGTRFEDITDRAGALSDGAWSTSAGALDLEGDGDLDLYVTRYIDYTTENAVRCYVNQTHTYCTPDLYASVSDRVLRNDGNARFTDVSDEVGIADLAGKGLALLLADIDGDRDVDAYLANDLTRNQLLMNDGYGHFNDIGLRSGVGYSDAGKEEAGMGADLTDVDGDGRSDIVVTNFQAEPNSMYLQRDGLNFRELSDAWGIGAVTRSRLGFGCDFFDVDNDGDEDLLVANGHVDDRVTSHTASVTFPQPNLLLIDVGERFVDVSADAGPALADTQVSRGLATGDLDGDGDLDYVVANNGGTCQVALNGSENMGAFLSLWLEGTDSNRSAIGAQVEATLPDGSVLRRQVTGASSYLSVCDARVHLGLGTAGTCDVRILWPSGLDQTFTGLAAGGHLRIVEGSDPQPYTPGERILPPH